MFRKILALTAPLLLLVGSAGVAAANSPIPVPSIPRGGPPEIRLEGLSISATVEDGVAEVRLDQSFVNHGAALAEGSYLFPLPTGASLSSFQMFVDGKPYAAEVLDADRARAIYEGIVRQNRDPALLQYVGQGLLQARVFPVPPGAERRVRVEYSQILPREGGLFELMLPLGAEAVDRTAVTVDLKGVTGGTVYSPTHEIGLTRGKDSTQVSLEGAGLRGDFRLFFGDEARTDLGVSLLTYKAAGEDGYFLLLANPPATSAPQVVAKDVIVIIDLSGSMAGEKFEQAKASAIQVLGAVGEQDRFGVIGFHSGTTVYANDLRSAREADSAIAWVQDLRLGGATNIDAAMAGAQRMAGSSRGRPQVLLLITDGQPTAGEQSADRIVEGVKGRATGSQRIFTFGVGYDVNTQLLDALAQENKGRSDYVRPGENLEAAVSQLWRRIGQPVLSDVRLTWAGAHVEATYPTPVPDLYLGSQLVLAGRYRQGGSGTLTISGMVNGESKSYRFSDLQFAERATNREYIPRLWANRKVGYLLSEIKRGGTNKELVDEVVALSQRFGIVTPYTSFFVNEPGMPPVSGPVPGGAPGTSAPTAPRPAEQVAASIKAEAPAGRTAVESAAAVNAIREAKSLSEVQARGAAADQVRYAGNKTFVRRDSIWTDTQYTGGPLTHLKVGSETYMKLMRVRPDLTRLFSVGSPLILVDGAINYGVEISGAEETTDPLPALPAGDPSLLKSASPPAQARSLLWPALGGLAVLSGLMIYRRRNAA